MTSINLLLANEIEDTLPKKVFLRLACTCEETCESVWPPNASCYASSTCVHLRLAGPFVQGLSRKKRNFKALAKRSRKLKTWVYLRLRLARPCVHLRWLAMTCAHFGRGQICKQVDASFSPFGHPTQVNARWVTSIDLLLANEIQNMSALKWSFCDSSVLERKLARPFGHPTQVSTQVQLAPTCDCLPLRLTRA